MRVAITGASGLVGAALSEALRSRGDAVTAISRSEGGVDTIQWDPGEGFDPPGQLSGFDAVVNLAGESISGRWTDEKKRKILDSRLTSTSSVVEGLRCADPRPQILINASATGIYGDRGDERLDEASELGPDDQFLVEVARMWETAAAQVASLEGPPVRLCLARFGVILDADGGALAKMLTPFKLGVGGKIGSGRQWMSWIHLRDVVAALLFMLDTAGASGPYNVVAPNPVRNERFTEALGDALERPTLLPLPKLGVKLALGEMGEALLLDGQRVLPAALVDAGFRFAFPELAPALADLV